MSLVVICDCECHEDNYDDVHIKGKDEKNWFVINNKDICDGCVGLTRYYGCGKYVPKVIPELTELQLQIANTYNDIVRRSLVQETVLLKSLEMTKNLPSKSVKFNKK